MKSYLKNIATTAVCALSLSLSIGLFGGCGSVESDPSPQIDTGEAEEAICTKARGEPSSQMNPAPTVACNQTCMNAVRDYYADRVKFACGKPSAGSNSHNCNPECDNLLTLAAVNSYVDSYCYYSGPPPGASSGGQVIADCPTLLDERTACQLQCEHFLAEGCVYSECPTFSGFFDYATCAQNCTTSNPAPFP